MIKEGRIKTEERDIEKFFGGLEKLEIAFEASSNYEYFYDLLESFGHKVVLAHPSKTKMIAEAKIKTDKIDAKTLAELLKGIFCQPLMFHRRALPPPLPPITSQTRFTDGLISSRR